MDYKTYSIYKHYTLIPVDLDKNIAKPSFLLYI